MGKNSATSPKLHAFEACKSNSQIFNTICTLCTITVLNRLVYLVFIFVPPPMCQPYHHHTEILECHLAFKFIQIFTKQ